jgi:prolyl-tRNA editing enzyme YbaK/EbsC (Cys-tRNA(Pro) deacylase)
VIDADEPIERSVLAHLESLGADYTAVRIDPIFANTALFCEQYGYAMEASANCILVAAKTGHRGHAACLVQATRRLDVNGTVRRLLGVRKASFAPAEETTELTGMLPDGVTPFGLPADLPLYVDAEVMHQAKVIVGGGSRSLKIEVATATFTAMPQAQIVEGLSRPPQ